LVLRDEQATVSLRERIAVTTQGDCSGASGVRTYCGLLAALACAFAGDGRRWAGRANPVLVALIGWVNIDQF
jgi:hypothetical protein